MKKYLAILLAVVMVLGSVACATAPAAPEAPAVTDAGSAGADDDRTGDGS